MQSKSIISSILLSAILLHSVEGQSSCSIQSDLVFLIDSSNSICSFSTTICSNYYRIRDFVEDFITHFQVSVNSGDLRVGCVVYSSLTKIYNDWTLNQYNSSSQLQSAAQSIRYDGGTTYTAAGLDYVVNNAMTSGNGARVNAKKIMILITDGAANDAADLASKIQLLDNAGIERYVVGVTSSVNSQQMNDIATDPDSAHVFTSTTFSDLVNVLLPTFQSQLCVQHAVTTTNAPTTVASTTASGGSTVGSTTASGGSAISNVPASTVPSGVPVQPVTLVGNSALSTFPFNVWLLAFGLLHFLLSV